MTVIVWDGNTFAADKQGQNIDVKVTVTKIFVSKDRQSVCGVSGYAHHTIPLRDWVFSGADPKKYPDFKKDNDGSTLSLIKRTGENFEIIRYESEHPLKIEDRIYATGTGREVAYGAMAMGAGAIYAVEVASKYIASVGSGVNAFCWMDAGQLYVDPETLKETILKRGGFYPVLF